MKLYLVRHGESEANLSGYYAGQSQVPLTETGRAQAKAAGALLQGLSFDRIYASDLIRAIHTQELALPGTTAEQMPLLREYDVGELVGKRFDDCVTQYGEPFLRDRAAGDYSPYGGEDRSQIVQRANDFLNLLLERGDETVIAFTHRGFLLSLLDAVTSGTIPHSTVCSDNCAINVLEYRNGRWQIRLWNYEGVI